MRARRDGLTREGVVACSQPDAGSDALSDSVADAQPDHTHSHAPDNNRSISLALNTGGGLHDRGLVELGRMLSLL